MYHYTDGGLRNVWLANGYTKQKTPFGEGVAIQDVEGLTRAICTMLTKRAGVLTGAELRYLRTAEGNLPIQRAVERIQTVERLTNQRIVVEELGGRWRPRVDDTAEGKELTAA